jgi:hypothetical protein
VVKTRITAVAALALAAACSSGGGSEAAQSSPAPRAAAPQGVPVIGGSLPSVFALIGARQQLSLTSAQVTELDSINRVWMVRNDTLQRALGAFDGRRGTPENVERMHPILIAIAENNQWAGGAVQGALNEEQRRIACTLPGGQGDPPPAQPPRRARRIPEPYGSRERETVPTLQVRRGWPWCSAPQAAGRGG